jgi:hypothetical protein
VRTLRAGIAPEPAVKSVRERQGLHMTILQGSAISRGKALRAKRRGGGGPAAGGGFNYQAAVTAIAEVYVARGVPLGWLEGLIDDTPISVAVETGGPGDDIRLVFRGGKVAEAQVKRGLHAGAEQRESLAKLADAIHTGDIDFGLLVVCPNASRTISQGLAQDLVRIGEGIEAEFGSLAAAFKSELDRRGLDAAAICARLRVVSVHALAHNDSSVRAAHAELTHLCRDVTDVRAAWDLLYRDAHGIIEFRGVRRPESIFRLLRSSGLQLRAETYDTRVSTLTRLCDWVAQVNDSFSILGIRTKFSIDAAWIKMALVIRARAEAEATDLRSALDRYHAWHKRTPSRDEASCSADTLGQFYRLAVVVGGPGMGKSTLLKRLARRYASEGYPVLRVSAKAVAQKMASGSSFDEAVFGLGLDGFDLSASAVRGQGLEDWVLLCDGLDECGAEQERVAEALVRFAAGHSGSRIVATTRPIGYRTSTLASWRHYDLVPLGEDDVKRHMGNLLSHIWTPDDPRTKQGTALAEAALEGSRAAKAVIRTPLLLGIATALVAHGGEIGRTRLELYRAIFNLIEAEPPSRAGAMPVARAVLGRVLDILGWSLISYPAERAASTLARCGEILAADLGCAHLKAQEIADRCLTYWEGVGLVERVQHGPQDALTLTHLTFGEFAAGRYLASLPRETKSTEIAARFDSDSWSEVMNFAAALGAGDLIGEQLVARGFAGVAGHQRMLQALEVLAEANPPLPQKLADRILDAAVESIRSDHPTWAYQVGSALRNVARRSPGAVSARCRQFLDHEQPWTRLAAWACCVEAGDAHYDLDTLLQCLKDLAGTTKKEPRRLGGGYLPHDSGGSLLQDFVCCAMAHVLRRCPADVADALLPLVLRSDGIGTVGFMFRTDRLLKAHGKPYRMADRYSDMGKPAMADLIGYDVAFRTAYRKILRALAGHLDDAQPRRSTHPFYDLAAFMQMSGLMKVEASDVWWWRDAYDAEAVEATLAGVIAISGLAPERLAEEALELGQAIENAQNDSISAMFDRLPEVDAPELDWSAARCTPLDLSRLEAALHHPSSYIVPLALNLLQRGAKSEDLRAMLPRLLLGGGDLTLWAASHLAMALPRGEALALLFGALSRRLDPGSHHFYDRLASANPENDERKSAALAAGLLCKNEQIAMAAAEWAVQQPLPGEQSSALLRQAYVHWQRTEKAYPTAGGTVPNSPRAKLLKARFQVETPTLPELLGYAGDVRSDVRDAATAALVDLLRGSPPDRRAFAAEAGAGSCSATLLTIMLKAKIPFSPDDVKALCALFERDEPDLRYAATGLLDPDYLEEAARRDIAGRLRQDRDTQIREAAIHALG